MVSIYFYSLMGGIFVDVLIREHQIFVKEFRAPHALVIRDLMSRVVLV